jgi:hypothetical protein
MDEALSKVFGMIENFAKKVAKNNVNNSTKLVGKIILLIFSKKIIESKHNNVLLTKIDKQINVLHFKG